MEVQRMKEKQREIVRTLTAELSPELTQKLHVRQARALLYSNAQHSNTLRSFASIPSCLVCLAALSQFLSIGLRDRVVQTSGFLLSREPMRNLLAYESRCRRSGSEPPLSRA
jgi:hypothetical protein